MWCSLKYVRYGFLCFLGVNCFFAFQNSGYACPTIAPEYETEAAGFSPRVTPSQTNHDTLSGAKKAAIEACEADLLIKASCSQADTNAATLCKTVPNCDYIHHAGEVTRSCGLAWCNMRFPLRDRHTSELRIYEVWYDEDGNTKQPPPYRQTQLKDRGFLVDPGNWLGRHTWVNTQRLYASDKEETVCMAKANVSCYQTCQSEEGPDVSDPLTISTEPVGLPMSGF